MDRTTQFANHPGPGMSDRHVLRVFYDRHLLTRATEGRHNFTNRLRAAVESRGVALRPCHNTRAARLLSAMQPGHALFHMDAPFHRRALTLRLAYAMPFWRIENSAKRWEWEVAKTRFLPETVDPDAARRFCNRQTDRILGDGVAEEKGGFVHIPLQGMVRKQRRFQMCSPIDMIRHTLDHCGGRRVVASLHPKEEVGS